MNSILYLFSIPPDNKHIFSLKSLYPFLKLNFISAQHTILSELENLPTE